MKKQLKFRGWDTLNKKMYYDGFFISPNNIQWKWKDENFSDTEIVNYSINQFVITDKNTNDIYEGDIVLVGKIKTVVKYKIGTFVLEIPENGKFYTFFDFTSCIAFEKIGNIYENPELIN